MLSLVGLILIFVLVFGGYIHSGGKIEIILHALPHELTMIFGAALGAFMVANKAAVVKKTGKALILGFKGPKWKKQDYKDLLCLLFIICKLMKSKGMIAVEAHIEKPEESSIFKQYPSILKDHFAVDMICDTLRTLTMGVENPMQIEDSLDKQIEKHHHEAAGPGHALQGMADGLPAIGIVAAVLGVIKTMASIKEPPEILGGMIGGALVGTFLGVFLAYCIVGPLASKNLAAHDQDQQFYFIIRDVLVAHLKGMAPQISMEMGRSLVPGYYQPTFAEMEELSGTLKIE
ncbi:MAG: flagellar motor stator protein MotA [Alphaproteobacteria bacterium]|nr:flagellar motor stator protein MotA [Alphaproteobacteria bacterium]